MDTTYSSPKLAKQLISQEDIAQVVITEVVDSVQDFSESLQLARNFVCVAV